MNDIEKKKQEAIDLLVKLGLLIPVKNVKLYHGRRKGPDETSEWKVNPKFNNSDNNTGNSNVNAIPTLSTGEYELAEEFAQERWIDYGRNGTPEVHRIIAGDNDLIFNDLFDYSKLTMKERLEVRDALRTLTSTNLSKVVPVDYEYKDVATIVFGELKLYKATKMKSKYFSDVDIENVANSLKKRDSRIDIEIVKYIASAMNTRELFKSDPGKALSRFVFGKGNKRQYFTAEEEGVKVEYPINMDYIASLVSDIGIVGVKTEARSVTVGRVIEGWYMFDLYHIETHKQHGDKVRQIMDDYLGISLLLNEFNLEENDVLPPLTTASPEEIMDKLNSNPEFGHLFRAPAKVWEEFSVGEHTETVLRIFDDNFANEMPSDLIPIMKLAIICHDIGKGMPAQPGETTMKRNLNYSHKFLEQFNLPRDVEIIIRFIMGPSQVYTSRYYIDKDKSAEHDLYVKCAELLTRLYGISPTDEQIKGLMGMCVMLQTCDSGAYTRYGITRDKETGVYYRNGNDRFTESFEKPADIGKKRLRLKEPKTL